MTPWTVAYQAPPSMGFSRQEYWSGLPFYVSRMGITAVLLKNTESQAPSKTFWIRMCILTRSPGDLHAQKHRLSNFTQSESPPDTQSQFGVGPGIFFKILPEASQMILGCIQGWESLHILAYATVCPSRWMATSGENNLCSKASKCVFALSFIH